MLTLVLTCQWRQRGFVVASTVRTDVCSLVTCHIALHLGLY